jgi:hypothetical protein
MSPSETISAVLAAAALLLSLPGTLLALRQLRTLSPAAQRVPAPRAVVFARLALFAYAATMCGIIAVVNAQEKEGVAPETAISYGVLALVAAGLGMSLGAGRNWARVAAWIFSGISLLYFVFLGLATIEESGLDPLAIALTMLVGGLAIICLVLLATSGAKAYFKPARRP